MVPVLTIVIMQSNCITKQHALYMHILKLSIFAFLGFLSYFQ